MNLKTNPLTDKQNQTILKNSNFLNNQNYLITQKTKKKIKYTLLAYFNKTSAKNHLKKIDLNRAINIINKKDIKDINKKNFYLLMFFTYIILFAIISFFFYLGSIFNLAGMFIIYLIFKGIKNFKQILKFKIFVGRYEIITLSSNLDIKTNNKINILIKEKSHQQIPEVVKNKNLLNNQKYIFGKKLENKISKGFLSLTNFGKLNRFYFFTMKQINNAYITRNIIKVLLIFFFFGFILMILLLISFLIFGDYWYIGLLIGLGNLIYYLFIHKTKLEHYKIIYDKDLVYFIKN